MPSPVSPSRLMFKRVRTREPWQQRGESRPRRSPPRRPPCSPVAQRSPAGAAPTPPPVAPRSRGSAVRGSPAPSKMVVLEAAAATAAAHGTRHPPTQPGSDGFGSPFPPTPGPGPLPWPCPVSPRACRRLPATAVAASGRVGAATRGAGEGIMGGGVAKEKCRGTPHSPPFCFPPFSCHPKPPTAKTTALAPPGSSGLGEEGAARGRDPHHSQRFSDLRWRRRRKRGLRRQWGKLGD